MELLLEIILKESQTLAAKEASGTSLGRAEKVTRFAQGAGAGGVAEGVFIGDVEDAGSFGDLLGGPTEIDRESQTPQAELLNRLKFGLEGAVFTGALRYPDVMTHRLLQHYLDGGDTPKSDKFEEKCKHSSNREELASKAERSSIKYMQVKYMQDHKDD